MDKIVNLWYFWQTHVMITGETDRKVKDFLIPRMLRVRTVLEYLL